MRRIPQGGIQSFVVAEIFAHKEFRILQRQPRKATCAGALPLEFFRMHENEKARLCRKGFRVFAKAGFPGAVADEAEIAQPLYH